jgi:hypothetical protein
VVDAHAYLANWVGWYLRLRVHHPTPGQVSVAVRNNNRVMTMDVTLARVQDSPRAIVEAVETLMSMPDVLAEESDEPPQ